jgi:hypothetical protein
MPIGFPSTPTTGQQWPTVSPRWEWDGTKWRALAALGSGATPITARLTTLAGTDDVIALRASVPYLASLAAIATYTGGSPAATAPAAMTAGQWSAEPTATPGQMGINIGELPNDGGSAPTAIQYRVNGGAAIALTGTGTGLRLVTADFTGGVPADIQVRSVNAVDANPDNWSDTKTRTPAEAPVGSGDGVEWLGFASVGSQNTGTVPTIPAGTTATDTLVLVVSYISSADHASMSVPTGWTARGSVFDSSSRGIAVYTAAGSVAAGSWNPGMSFGFFDVFRAAGVNQENPVRGIPSFTGDTWPTGADWPNMPSPSVTAVAGDGVLAFYHGGQTAVLPGAGQAGYTRTVERMVNGSQSALWRSNLDAGATGDIAHGYGQAYETRSSITVLLAGA